MSSAAEAVERERKFSAADHMTIPDVAGASVVARSHVRLTATYWDTARRRLLRWGHTLRYRHASDGSEDRWTLKLALPSRTTDGELRRIEVHAPGLRLYPPSAIRGLARAIVRSSVLRPIATIVTDRRRIELTGEEPTERVELSDDRVSSVVGLHRGPAFRQIEVEALSAEANGLMDDASNALVGVGAVPTDASKLATVLVDTPEPEITLPRSGARITLRDVVRIAIGSGATRLIANDPAARIGSDPEAIHQARVASRRLRSDLKTLEPFLDRTAVERIRNELRWVGELLGAVRDTDVLIARVERAGKQLRLEPDTTSAIVAELDHDRLRSHATLVQALGSRRYVTLVRELVAAAKAPPLVEGLDGERRAGSSLRKVVRKSWRRVPRAVDSLGDDPSDAALHEVRKRAKRARYAAELAATALEEDEADLLAERVADLQDVLGELQDAVVAEERLTELVRDGRISGGAAFAAGKLACAMAQARTDARDRWSASWKAARGKRLRRWLR